MAVDRTRGSKGRRRTTMQDILGATLHLRLLTWTGSTLKKPTYTPWDAFFCTLSPLFMLKIFRLNDLKQMNIPMAATITVSSNSEYFYPSRVSLQRILAFPATPSCSWPLCFHSIARSVQHFKKWTANFSRYRAMIAPITHHVV